MPCNLYCENRKLTYKKNILCDIEYININDLSLLYKKLLI